MSLLSAIPAASSCALAGQRNSANLKHSRVGIHGGTGAVPIALNEWPLSGARIVHLIV